MPIYLPYSHLIPAVGEEIIQMQCLYIVLSYLLLVMILANSKLIYIIYNFIIFYQLDFTSLQNKWDFDIFHNERTTVE